MTVHAELREQHRKEQQSLMRVAAKDGSLSVVEGFLRAGFDVNRRDEDDQSSAIMLACQNGHENVVKLLIEWGAEINVSLLISFEGVDDLEEIVLAQEELIISHSNFGVDFLNWVKKGVLIKVSLKSIVLEFFESIN